MRAAAVLLALALLVSACASAPSVVPSGTAGTVVVPFYDGGSLEKEAADAA